MTQQDSIHQPAAVAADDAAVVHHGPLTPAQVLRWLPRDATPAQQDSAIQSRFKPSPIRWSKRPDTLHLPGHDKGHNLLDIKLPQYYREGFFSKDSLFHPELPGGRYGTAGDPLPYTVRTDNVITLLLLLSFTLAVVSFASMRTFIARQARSFFYTPRKDAAETSETTVEVRFQLFLMVLSALLLSLLFYFYTVHHIGTTFILQSQYTLIGIYMAIVTAYFLMKLLLYTLANNVFFDSKRNGQWLNSLLFITAIESVLLYPAVLLLAYFNMSFGKVEIYFIIALSVVKFLTIYRCYIIFFSRNIVKLQIILYLCALEIVPLLLLWGFMDLTANSLKINY